MSLLLRRPPGREAYPGDVINFLFLLNLIFIFFRENLFIQSNILYKKTYNKI